MDVLIRTGCIRAKVVVIGRKLFYSGKVVVFGQNWLYLDKSGCIRAEVVVLGQRGSFRSGWVFLAKWLYWGKSICIRTK